MTPRLPLPGLDTFISTTYEAMLRMILDGMTECLQAGAAPLVLLEHGKAQAAAKGTSAAYLARFLSEAVIIGWCRGRGVEVEWPKK